jgi:serine/threonine-protein kinase
MSAPGSVVLGRRYALGEKIGAGGFSEVWRANDVVLARPVAIKLLHLGYAQHAEALTRFRAEAQHAGGLSHENIARVYDYGEPDPPQPPYLVMELVAGPSLAGMLAAGPLDPARGLDIVAQTASGLHAAHLAGLVHRDIKPGNLLLAPGGVVKITDFGIARAADSAPVTGTGQLVGTPGYLAPEQAMGEPATPASDLYALGIVAYECLAGAPPFTGPALAVALAHRERPLPPLPGQVPADVAALVLELTAKNPAARPRSAGEVARRASQLAGRLAAGAVAQGGAPFGDPGITVAEQTARYPGVAPGYAAAGPAAAPPGPGQARHARTPQPPVAEPPTRHLVSRPGTPPRHSRARREFGRAVLPAAAAVAVIAAALVIGSLIGPGPAPHAGTVPSATPSGPVVPASKASTVDVRLRPLIGEPVAVATQRLRQQGLSVRIAWRRSDEQPPGTVLSVQPSGRRPVGSLVTLTAALRPRQHGHQGGGDQQQGGDQQGDGDNQGGAPHGQGHHGKGHHGQDSLGG